MKGVILAGGLGTRLYPLTKITNKHLLPIYNKPMIYYPIEALVNAGITDIVVVTGGTSAGDFFRLLGNGKAFGLKHLHYMYQDGEGGIADALGLVQPVVGDDRMVVILGDNLIEKNLRSAVKRYQQQESGAMIMLKEVPDPEHYGVAELRGDKVVSIEEKPRQPKSNLAVIGIYMYDSFAFDIIETLEPSARGELEITDVNNAYLREGNLRYEVLDGWWADAGESHDSLKKAWDLVSDTGANNE